MKTNVRPSGRLTDSWRWPVRAPGSSRGSVQVRPASSEKATIELVSRFSGRKSRAIRLPSGRVTRPASQRPARFAALRPAGVVKSIRRRWSKRRVGAPSAVASKRRSTVQLSKAKSWKTPRQPGWSPGTGQSEASATMMPFGPSSFHCWRADQVSPRSSLHIHSRMLLLGWHVTSRMRSRPAGRSSR